MKYIYLEKVFLFSGGKKYPHRRRRRGQKA